VLMAIDFTRSSPTVLKGRPPPRKCPEDFDVIFVEKGRDGCEAWYRARRTTITRWLVERGKDRLIKARESYVKCLRSEGKWLTRSSRLVDVRPARVEQRQRPIADRRRISPTLARHAAQHLRIVRYGGYIVSPAQNGDWWVGSRRLSAAQMVDLACAKGFDRTVPIEVDEPTSDRIVRHPENIGRAKAAVLAQRPDGSTYLPNQRRQAIIRGGNLHDDGDEGVN
jgi:hypothetical protein